MDKTLNKIEKLHIQVLKDKEEGACIIAGIIAEVILKKQAKNEMAIIGLATGSSPIKVYRELVRMHLEEGLSFQNVVTFNLDEYYPMDRASEQSYYYFMHKHLFNDIDIKPENVHIPDGSLPLEKVNEFCAEYDEKIRKYGGIDIQLLGIGRSGHIGFNEPGSTVNSGTRLINLDSITIEDAIKDFGSEEAVPRRAITMGIEPILNAKKIVLAGWGKPKSSILKKMIEGPVTAEVPASFLQLHNNVEVFLDQGAISEFTRSENTN